MSQLSQSRAPSLQFALFASILGASLALVAPAKGVAQTVVTVPAGGPNTPSTAPANAPSSSVIVAPAGSVVVVHAPTPPAKTTTVIPAYRVPQGAPLALVRTTIPVQKRSWVAARWFWNGQKYVWQPAHWESTTGPAVQVPAHAITVPSRVTIDHDYRRARRRYLRAVKRYDRQRRREMKRMARAQRHRR